MVRAMSGGMADKGVASSIVVSVRCEISARPTSVHVVSGSMRNRLRMALPLPPFDHSGCTHPLRLPTFGPKSLEVAIVRLVELATA